MARAHDHAAAAHEGSARGDAVPILDVAPLFGADAHAWAVPDQGLSAAARDTGFVCIRGLPEATVPAPAARARLLAIFALSHDEKRRLYRRQFAPENANIYRGWFPVQPANLTFKEGIDFGGDLAHGPGRSVPGDPLREPSALPEDERLPGWRAASDCARITSTGHFAAGSRRYG